MSLTVRITKDGTTKTITNAKIISMPHDKIPDYIKDDRGNMHMVCPMGGPWKTVEKP